MLLLDKITHGDCFEVLLSIPDGSIDMVLCDLPYGLTGNEWDTPLPLPDLWEQYKRVCKPNAAIVLTAAQPFASRLIASNEKMYKYDWIWVKNKSSGFLNAKKMPLRIHEHILVFYASPPTYNPQITTGHKPMNGYTKTVESANYGKQKPTTGGGSTSRYPTSVLNFPVLNNDSPDRIHPTQKPVELFEYLVRTYTNEGETVLDNCIGSGTTAIACLRNNRKYIGIEASKEYWEAACKRIANETVPLC